MRHSRRLASGSKFTCRYFFKSNKRISLDVKYPVTENARANDTGFDRELSSNVCPYEFVKGDI